MNTYLFHYSSQFSRGQMKKFLDSRPDILYWVTCLPNSFFIVSTASAAELTDAIHQQFTDKGGSFIFLNTRGERDGWLPESVWDLIAKPRQELEKLGYSVESEQKKIST